MEMIETGPQLGLNTIYYGRVESVNASVDLKVQMLWIFISSKS